MSRIRPTSISSMDTASGASSSLTALSEDGELAAQLNGKDLILHLNPISSDFKEVQIVKVKDAGCKFLKFSRPTQGIRRVIGANDFRVTVWNLDPLQQHAEIENLELGALNIEFGGDENEVVVFHAFNTKLAIFGLDSGRSHVLKSPKFSHQNGFGYRPKTGQLAILLKPETTDLLTVHESRSYEVIGREVLPTVDAQGLKWSPDGRWIAVWEAASAGTKVLIFTADGQFFRTYTGLPESYDSFDLGVRCIEWSPPVHGSSEVLAVGKVDGTVDLLGSKTFACSSTLSHVFQGDEHSPSIWRERYAAGGMSLEYAESSSSSAFTIITEPTGAPRGVSLMTFSPDGMLLSTVDQTRSNIVWIWSLEDTPTLVSALVHEHAVRQATWHPASTQLLITTANSALPGVRCWNPHQPPCIAPAGKQKKKWSKGKVKDKAQHAVVLEKQTAERLNKDVQSYRLITVATLVDRLKINGSLARKALADLEEKGQIKKVVGHSKMNIYTRAVTAE
ncbi:S25 ribosomal protein-domain-containing protein [Aspergillus undulatus]|uniref:S25 ribosomal protein-domain-containing protein n=1 Tax=Aspergillus undulatus TaxID=1810928 RepID=UPI003CCD3674